MVAKGGVERNLFASQEVVANLVGTVVQTVTRGSVLEVAVSVGSIANVLNTLVDGTVGVDAQTSLVATVGYAGDARPVSTKRIRVASTVKARIDLGLVDGAFNVLVDVDTTTSDVVAQNTRQAPVIELERWADGVGVVSEGTCNVVRGARCDHALG